jgi:hypothetical protein
MENIKILEKHFRKGMINNNFELFKKDYPTLLKCILGAMDEALSQHDVIKSICEKCRSKSFVHSKKQNKKICLDCWENEQTVL